MEKRFQAILLRMERHRIMPQAGTGPRDLRRNHGKRPPFAKRGPSLGSYACAFSVIRL